MIKRILIGCLIILCSYSGTSNAETWQYITEYNDTKYYYDSDSVIYWSPTYIAEYNETLVSINADIKEEGKYTKFKNNESFSYILVNNDIVDIKFMKNKAYVWNYKENDWMNTGDKPSQWYNADGVMERVALHLYKTHY